MVYGSDSRIATLFCMNLRNRLDTWVEPEESESFVALSSSFFSFFYYDYFLPFVSFLLGIRGSPKENKRKNFSSFLSGKLCLAPLNLHLQKPKKKKHREREGKREKDVNFGSRFSRKASFLRNVASKIHIPGGQRISSIRLSCPSHYQKRPFKKRFTENVSDPRNQPRRCIGRLYSSIFLLDFGICLQNFMS